MLTGEDALYHEALATAPTAILRSANLETEAFTSVRTLLKQGDARRAGVLEGDSALTGCCSPSRARPGKILAGARG